MALKIVATHDVDGQPRAISASTSHCVSKRRFVAAVFLRRHHPEDAGIAQRVEALLRHAPGAFGRHGALAQHRDESGRALDQRAAWCVGDIHRPGIIRSSARVATEHADGAISSDRSRMAERPDN